MHRVDGQNVATSLPTPKPVGTPGYFNQGNPATGTQATVVTDDWANAVQEEICYVITHAGLTLNKLDRTQLDQAIRLIGAAGVLGFTPVQQGGGAGQLSNKIYIGWDGSHVKAQVDTTDMGGIAMLSSSGQHFTTAQTFDSNVAVAGQLSGTTISSGSGGITAGGGNVTASAGRLRAAAGAYGSGDGNAATLLSDFTFASAANGYIRLPNGFILQWLSANAYSSGGGLYTVNVPLPVSYASSHWFAHGMYGGASPPRNVGLAVQAFGVSQCQLTTQSASGDFVGNLLVSIISVGI